jgi:hypothetical protein
VPGYATGVVAVYPFEPIVAQAAPLCLSDALSGADSYLAGMGVAVSLAETSATNGEGAAALTRLGPPRWVGVPLGQNELAAFWQGASCCPTVARQATKRAKKGPASPEPRADATPPLLEAMATREASPLPDDGADGAESQSSEDDISHFLLQD